MRLGSRPCDYRCGVTIQRDRRPGSLPHPEPSRAPDLDLSLHPTLPRASHSRIMLTVKCDDGAMETMLPPWQFSMDLAVLEFQKFRDSLLNVRFLVHFFWHIFGCVAYEKTPKPWYSNVPGFSIPVRAGGVEPPRAYTHCHLKTARLPFRHARRQSTNLHLYYLWHKSACRTAVFAKRMHKAVRREEGGGPVDLQTMEPSFVQKAAFA